ncbi:hypothetical protein KSF78_0008308 [Schistosoma japonicum]|nr:hypothetical protein KSF78_0008308 [Schistosoma japonicum]
MTKILQQSFGVIMNLFIFGVFYICVFLTVLHELLIVQSLHHGSNKVWKREKHLDSDLVTTNNSTKHALITVNRSLQNK